MSDPRRQSGLASTVGVELSVNGSDWTELRFRMANYHLCKEHSTAGVITFAIENFHPILLDWKKLQLDMDEQMTTGSCYNLLVFKICRRHGLAQPRISL